MHQTDSNIPNGLEYLKLTMIYAQTIYAQTNHCKSIQHTSSNLDNVTLKRSTKVSFSARIWSPSVVTFLSLVFTVCDGIECTIWLYPPYSAEITKK
mmetsp:Transcript_2328/g.8630  ORF Transcript_2328/g.8630 Transcript_2328/m.8630 type:complete len:96 (-) Transcript_2328:420-707(-)